MKKRITALLTAISLTFGLAGCSQKPPEKYTATEIKETTDENNKTTSPQDIYQKYDNYFQNYNIDYTEAYISNNDINTHISNASNTITCNFNSNLYMVEGIYDTKLIINKIKENNNKYVKENQKFANAFFGEDYSTNETVEACKLRFEVSFELSLRKIIETASNNIAEDLCNITKLKCVLIDNETYFKYNKTLESSIDNYGIYVPEENLIIINGDHLINLYNSTDVAEFNDILNSVIYHLLNHVRQHSCNCIEKNNNYPFNYPGIIDNTILYEASAESSYYNEFGGLYQDNNNFDKEQTDEKLLFLLSIFTSSNINDYYNAIYDGNINLLHQFFGLNSKEEIYEFYKIIYSIDGKNGNNTLLEQEDRSEVENNYKESILKLTLKNMVNYTHNNTDFTIEENISLLSLVNYILNVNYHNATSNSNYINNIYTLNNEYISFLQNYYNVPKDKMDYYLSDYYIDKIIEEVLNSYNIIDESERKLPLLLERFPNLKYVLNINLEESKSMNELIKTK